MLDEDGQPVSDGNGDTALVSDDECWLQDIKNEAMTEEGELFYEDEEGDASYGWSLLDFMQGEYDDFTQMEIQQRIRSKMSKRDYIDAGSIQTTVNFDGHIYHIRIQRLITTGRQTSCNRLMTWFLNRTRSSWQETSM